MTKAPTVKIERSLASIFLVAEAFFHLSILLEIGCHVLILRSVALVREVQN
jgi:uncharacterized membrane protein YhfC